jgi:hypothetical protein
MDASSADPLAIMDQAMTRDAEDPPETLFLAWLLSLPRDLDPAEAARRMLLRFAHARPEQAGPGRLRLVELLNDTTRWSSERLSCLARGPQRRQAAGRQRDRRQTGR